MGAAVKSRRAFLLQSATGLSAAWVAANYPAIVAAQEYAQEAARMGRARGFAFFTRAQGIEVEAMTAQIIPTDQTPGAREAHVVQFIDRALVTFEQGRQNDYKEGLEDLAARTNRLFPDADMFSSLDDARQIRVLEAMEESSFFALVRTHTITGFFASPVHGGNCGKVGWKLIGYDDSLDHEPPFGYYDSL